MGNDENMKTILLASIILVLISCEPPRKKPETSKSDTTKKAIEPLKEKEQNLELACFPNISVELANKQFKIERADLQNWPFPLNNEEFLSFCDTIQYNHYPVAVRAEYIEMYSLKKDSLLVKRDGLNLIFRLKNGKTKILIDHRSFGDTSIGYLYREYLQDIGFYVCFVGLYEETRYLLINDTTGEEFWVNGIPKISLDNKMIAASPYDVGAGGFNDNNLNIWLIKDKRIEKIYSFNMNNLVWNSDWSGNNTLKFQIRTSDTKRECWGKDMQKLPRDCYTVYDLKITEIESKTK